MIYTVNSPFGVVRVVALKGERGAGVEDVRKEVAALKGAVGSPLVATTAAGMTDKTKVYVYTGSQTGYTSGHWYYWNSSTWTDGGVYNAAAVNTDATLSVSGMAADAAATGDIKNVLNVDEYLINKGEYTVAVSDMEQGYWAYSTKSVNDKRLRHKILIHVHKGMTVTCSSPTLKVFFGVMASESSQTYLYSSGWIAAGTDVKVTIQHDGYMTFMVEGVAGITSGDYNATFTINTVTDKSIKDLRIDIAPAYNASSTYAVGQIISNGDQFYTCSTAITEPEEWNPAHWQAIYLASIIDGRIGTERARIDDLRSDIAKPYDSAATYSVDNIVSKGAQFWRCTTSITTPEEWNPAHWMEIYLANIIDGRIRSVDAKVDDLRVDMAPPYDATRAYAVGDIVSNGTQFWYCTTAITEPEEWNPAHWLAIYLITMVKWMLDTADADLRSDFLLPYNPESTYAIGDLCSYGKQFWYCITDIVTPEEWNADHWQAVYLATTIDNKTRQNKAAIADLSENVSFLANVSDAVRKNDLFEGSQYPAPNTNHGITVSKIKCGVHVDGTLPCRTFAWINRAAIRIEEGEQYTLFADGNSKGVYLTIHSDDGYDAQVSQIYTRQNHHAYTFIAPVTTDKVYITLYQSWEEDGMAMNEDLRVFLAKGTYTEADFDRAIVSGADPTRYRERTVRPGMTVGLPVLYLNGIMTGISKDNKVSLGWEYKGDSGTCTLKWQGASSVVYEKKNYTITLDHAIDVGWGNQKKYCLKANFVDPSHAMNICAARLWSQIVADRNENPCIGISPNNGAMDGFPIIVMLNGAFHGLYTWNIPKDKWAFGMGSGAAEYIVTSEAETQATYFKALALLDGSDFELEYAPDNVEMETVRAALNEMIDTVINSTGVNWEASVNPLIDVNSVIDYMILTAVTTDDDALGHNYILTTYDGTRWWMNAYDMDATFGSHWTGSYYLPTNHARTMFAGQNNIVRLHHLVYRYSPDKLIQRYQYLRQGILSEDNVHTLFNNFAVRIPEKIRQMEYDKFPTLPGTSTQNIGRIMGHYRLRCGVLDREIEELAGGN